MFEFTTTAAWRRNGLAFALSVGFAAAAQAQTSAPSPGNPIFAPQPQTDGSFFMHKPLAQDELFLIGGGLEAALQMDYTRPGTGKRYANLFSEGEGSVYVNVARYFTLNSVFKWEQLKDQTSHAAFRHTGAYMDQLYGVVNLEPVQLFGGKTHPRFGLGWDLAPGLYGADFAEDYELTEKIGFGFVVHLPIDWGRHEFSAEWFMADRSIFSRSLFTRTRFDDPLTARPGKLRYDDGGLSNTRAPSSYAINLVGRNVPVGELGSITYSLSYSRQAAGVTEMRSERAFAFGVQWEIPFTRRVTLVPTFEYVHLEGFQGQNRRADYLLVGLEMFYYAWKFSGAVGLRDIKGEQRTRDWLFTLSAGYDLYPWTGIRGLEANVGWRHAREDGRWNDRFGAQLVYGIRF